MSKKANTFKFKVSSGKGESFFAWLERRLRINGLFEEGLPDKLMPKILFATIIGLLYIGNRHFSDKLIRKIDRLQAEVEELRADYTTLKAGYMFDSKMSEVEKKVKTIGLTVSTSPPEKILVEDSEY